MILAKAQLERVGAEEAKIAALIEAREAQEALGRQIQKTAQLNWAEEVMAKAVQTNFHAPSSLETTPARIPDEVFPIIRSTFGFGHEQDLRLGLALLEKETGRSLKEIVPDRRRLSRLAPSDIRKQDGEDSGNLVCLP